MVNMFEDDTYWKICLDFILAVKTILTVIFCRFLRIVLPKCYKSVRNKVVLVTGAGSGLGRQICIEFSRLGAVVVLWDTNQRGLEETKTLIIQAISEKLNNDDAKKEKSTDCVCDVGNKEEVHRVGSKVKEEVGDVDILVNNAGIVTGKPILDIPDEKIIEIFNVNLLAHFWTVKCFLPAMLTRNQGHIVSIASSCGFAGISKLLDYSATKFGVMGFSEVLNYENTFSGHSGVHVTTVCPSFVKTGMFQGCQMRYPYITPDLEVKDTVDTMMRGILREEHVVYIPRRIWLVPFIKSMLPCDAWIAILRFFGADKFMDSFQGRCHDAS